MRIAAITLMFFAGAALAPAVALSQNGTPAPADTGHEYADGYAGDCNACGGGGGCNACNKRFGKGGKAGGGIGSRAAYRNGGGVNSNQMPQTCYQPHYGCYPSASRWTHRYPAFHGYYYRRPYNYRNLFDYPWHAQLHEPTSLFSYHVPPEQSAPIGPGIELDIDQESVVPPQPVVPKVSDEPSDEARRPIPSTSNRRRTASRISPADSASTSRRVRPASLSVSEESEGLAAVPAPPLPPLPESHAAPTDIIRIRLSN